MIFTPIYHITIAERIKEYRKEHRLSQGAFGKLIGVSAQAVYKWEQEVCYPDIIILPCLARILGCTTDEFFITDNDIVTKAEPSDHSRCITENKRFED